MVKNPPANANPKDSGLTEQGFPGGSEGKESDCSAGDQGLILGSGGCLEKGILGNLWQYSWRIPWTEEPGGLQPIGS